MELEEGAHEKRRASLPGLEGGGAMITMKRITGAIKKYRVQLDFQEDAFEELEVLQNDMGVPSRAEVFRHSLRLMQWMIEQLNADNVVLLRTPSGTVQEIVLPFLRKRKTEQSVRANKKEELVLGTAPV
jgi:hypothetical protein